MAEIGVGVTRANRVSISSRTAVCAGAAIATILIAVGGCTAVTPEPLATRTAATATPAPTPTATPTADPTLVEGGTAGQNRPYLEFVITRELLNTPQPSSLFLVDTLVAAGFDRVALQVTEDTTRVGDPADSILFSVLINEQCLLGQVAQGAVTTELADVLGTGRCLVGRTLSLD